MIRNEQLRRLTWSIFIKNKIKEIVFTILIMSAIVFIPFLLGHYIGDNQSWFCGELDLNECDNFFQWFEGVIYLVGGAIICLIIYSWLSSNWKKAEKKAKKKRKLKQNKDNKEVTK